MAELKRNALMDKELDQFLSRKTCTDINREKFIPCALRDNTFKVTTCLMFNCNCHSYEDPTVIECECTGAVIYLPAFWLEVPKELAFTYLASLIDDLYAGTYRQWMIDGSIGNAGGNGSDSGSGSGCGCGCNPNGWN